MNFECFECGDNEFIVRDGLTFCKSCRIQSQDIGLSTVIDEDTMCLSQSKLNLASQVILSNPLEKSLHSRKRRRKQVECWDTCEAFTFILRAWVDEIEKLSLTSNKFSDITFQLWAKYLQILRRAFLSKGDRVVSLKSLGNLPTFHDIQVNFAKRTKLIDTHYGWMLAKLKYNFNMEDLEEIYLSSFQERRRLIKKRRRFYSSESNRSTSEQSSFSFNSTSNFEDFSSSNGNENSTQEALETDESNGEEEENTTSGKSVLTDLYLARYLKSCRLSTCRASKRNNNPNRLSLNNALHVLCLALKIDRSKIMFSDISRWIRENNFSYNYAVTHIPTILRMKTSDIRRFNGRGIITTNSLDLNVLKMACFLDVESYLPKRLLFFNECLQLFIEELCLPWELNGFIKKFVKKNDLNFTKLGKEFHMEIYIINFILFSLKYLFNLNGTIEESSQVSKNVANTSEGNRQLIDIEKMFQRFDLSSKKEFSFKSWHRLSRRRMEIFSKYSFTYNCLFKSQELTSNSCSLNVFKSHLREVEELNMEYSCFKSAHNLGRSYSFSSWSTNRRDKVENKAFLENIFQCDSEEPNEVPQLELTRTPFSSFAMTLQSSNMLSREEFEELEELKAMKNHSISNYLISKIDSGTDKLGEGHNLQEFYHRYKLEKKVLIGANREDLADILPQSFYWLLIYISASFDVSPNALYVSYSDLEKMVLNDFDLFANSEFNANIP